MTLIVAAACQRGIVVGADSAWIRPGGVVHEPGGKLHVIGGCLVSISGLIERRSGIDGRLVASLPQTLNAMAPTPLSREHLPAVAATVGEMWREHYQGARILPGSGVETSLMFWWADWTLSHFEIRPAEVTPVRHVDMRQMGLCPYALQGRWDVQQIVEAGKLSQRARVFLDAGRGIASGFGDALAFVRDVQAAAAREMPDVGGDLDVRMVRATDGGVETLA